MTKFARTGIARPRTDNPASLTVRQVGAAYNYPLSQASGKGYVGGIIELGGGYKQAQVAKYFTDNGLPTPTFVSRTIGKGSNSPDGPNGADGEVQLDMITAGAIAPAATFIIYFADNTDASFLAAHHQAGQDCDGISVSWGAAEPQWSTSVMDQFEASIKEARGRGVPTFVASGDTGSRDSERANAVDFPASAPSAVGCGGTRLELNADGTRASEVVWNNSPTSSATGGGVSKHFPGRQVPDVAGNADPDTGYEIYIDGKPYVIGGTSAVAPLMLGLHGLLWEIAQANHKGGFDFGNLIVTNPQACYDVTIGNNGGFKAGPGRDQTTGFGVPDGGKLVTILVGGNFPVPPGPTPTPPAPTPTQVSLKGTFHGTFTPDTGAT